MASWPGTRTSLIQRLADPADRSAWDEFEASYKSAIYRYVRSYGVQPADAVDTVQEILLAVHRKAARWEPSAREGSFRAWLAETTKRLTLYHIRLRDRAGKGTGRTSVMMSLSQVEQVTDEPSGIEEEQRWQFCCAAAKVEAQTNPTSWQAFWMTAVEGRRAKEVAAELGMKVGTVYSARCRVQAAICKIISEQVNQD